MNSAMDDVWQEILKNLELPSTRLLLSQQANLAIVDEKEIVILVAKNWIGMVQSRTDLIQQCVDRVLPGRTVIIRANG